MKILKRYRCVTGYRYILRSVFASIGITYVCMHAQTECGSSSSYNMSYVYISKPFMSIAPIKMSRLGHMCA